MRIRLHSVVVMTAVIAVVAPKWAARRARAVARTDPPVVRWASASRRSRGRKHVLVAGWLVAVPVPFMLMWGPSWNWILAANVLLGISQGFTWSTTVIMKIDLVGPARRGLAMGLNEFAGYVAVAASALATGWIAARTGLRPEPLYPGVIFVAFGLGLSAVLVRETSDHVALESTRAASSTRAAVTDVFWRTTWTDRNLSTISQVGLVNN
jgi:MFS family permease